MSENNHGSLGAFFLLNAFGGPGMFGGTPKKESEEMNNQVTYTITVDRDMFPYPPGSEVVVRDNHMWDKAIFVGLYGGSFVCFLDGDKVSTLWRECHPLATHGHLLGTTYPADTPACAKCGKAQPDCVCRAMKEWLESARKTMAEAFAARGVKQKPQFQPFQRVLVRGYDDAEWCLAEFSHYDKLGHCVSGGMGFKQCIPYTGNEHLLGTTDAPGE